MYELYELRKNHELFNRLVDAAMIIETHQRKGLIYEFSFSIKYPTQFGERIVVTGDVDFLGSWEPANGLQLEWQRDGVWKAEVIVVDAQISEFQYKYVCIKPDSSKWEDGANRFCKVNTIIGLQSFISINMQDTWQHDPDYSKSP
jgi:hypothetical protein